MTQKYYTDRLLPIYCRAIQNIRQKHSTVEPKRFLLVEDGDPSLLRLVQNVRVNLLCRQHNTKRLNWRARRKLAGEDSTIYMRGALPGTRLC